VLKVYPGAPHGLAVTHETNWTPTFSTLKDEDLVRLPLEIGEDAVPLLGAQRIEALLEEALVIHAGAC
jgi:hypothetical protein